MFSPDYPLLVDRYLEQSKIAPAEFWILNDLFHGSADRDQLLETCVSVSSQVHASNPIDKKDWLSAYDELGRKGLIRLVTDADRFMIVDDLFYRKVLGPYEGLPDVGTVDLTKAGALFSLEMRANFVHEKKDYLVTSLSISDDLEEVIGTGISEVEDFIAIMDRSVECVGSIVPVGRWCSRWWHEHPCGFHAVVKFGGK